MNSKDLSEEVKDGLNSLKISVMLYFKMESFCLENQIPALKTNAPKHKDLSNALYKEGLIEVPHAKLAVLTLNFLQIIIFVNT